ncbi:MAG: hypothetical protein JWN07_2052 [Hyphomicrobiales bacterium]|nr:hypothetical protein [Hyphomicrobiales bacterium]
MLIKELIITCSHDAVAEAGVISIGPAFHARVARAANHENMRVGAYAARAVRTFSAEAAAADWEELRDLCAHEDMPILRGLHHIVERAIERDSEDWCTCVAGMENAARHAAV